MKLERRELLFSGTAALAVGLAGCAAEPLDDDDEEDDTADDDGADDIDDADDEDTDDGDTDDGFEDDDVDDEDTDDVDDEDTDDVDDEDTDDVDDEDGGDDTDDEEGTDDDAGTDDGEDADEDVAEPPVHSLTVTVLGPAGERVEGATVYGEGEAHEANIPLEFVGETDANGTYTEDVYENEYTIEVSHGNFETATIEHSHDGASELTVELDSGEGEPGTASLSLWVTNAVGDPIEGAEVLGTGDDHPSDIPLEFSGQTDADGLYSDVIYENEYTVEVSHPDYVTETIEHSHDGDSEVVVTLEGEDEPGTAGLTLRVVDGEGNPIEGAEVLGTGDDHPSDIPLEFSGQTNANGVYGDVIYQNEYTIEIDHPDYTATTLRHDHRMDSEVEVELQPEGESILTVRAVHPVWGGPVEGVTVSVKREDGTGREFEAETGPNGIATFDVDPGEYRIVAYERELYRTNPMATTARVGEDSTTVQVRATVEPEDCSATIEVVDGASGDPIENAAVSVDVHRPDHDLMEDGDGETGADGTVEITTWCGEWEISARADGYQQVPRERAMVDGDHDEPITLEIDPDA